MSYQSLGRAWSTLDAGSVRSVLYTSRLRSEVAGPRPRLMRLFFKIGSGPSNSQTGIREEENPNENDGQEVVAWFSTLHHRYLYYLSGLVFTLKPSLASINGKR